MSHELANKVIAGLWTLFCCISLVLLFGYMTLVAIDQLPDPKTTVTLDDTQ